MIAVALVKRCKDLFCHHLVLRIVHDEANGRDGHSRCSTLSRQFRHRNRVRPIADNYISSSTRPTRPPASVIIESTEISGMDVFEEVVRLDDIAKLRDPLKQRLMELVQSHGENLEI